MRKFVVTSALTVGVAIAGAYPAQAGTTACVGPSSAYVCATVYMENLPTVHPDENEIRECIYLGGTNCEPVVVKYPGVHEGSGPLVEVGCGGFGTCE